MIAWVCFVLATVAIVVDGNVIDGRKSLVWGPAIELPELDLPVRYFFVQLVGSDGLNITRPPQNSLVVGWTAPNCRLKRQTIDRHDGSFVVRFRLYDACDQVEFSLSTADGQPIAQTPYTIRKPSGRPLLAEHCDCGQLPTTDEWLTMAKCPAHFAQLDRDLANWSDRSVDFEKALNYSHQRWTGPEHRYSSAVCHYQIINNEIYRKCFGEHVGFKMFSDQIFTSLARKMRLPNVEFLMNLGDWPLEDGKDSSKVVPLLSWCGSDRTKDIIFPTYELVESTLKMMDRVSLDIHSAQGDSDPWSAKIDKAIFRGRDSRQERLDLVLMARRHPDLLDAGITRFFFFNDVKHKYEPTVEQRAFADFFNYRYVINVDGTVAAYRLPFLLSGDSLVLKQDSSFYEHFYHEMEPFVHYLPLKGDLSDVIEQISWAREHPEQVARMIANARQFVHDHLQPQHIFCYHALLLQRYARLLINTPTEPNSDMEQVSKAAHDYYGQCTCDKRKDEL